VKVETFDRLEAVDPAAWSALHARARLHSPFLSLDWQREWVAAFAADRRLDVRTVKDADGQLVAVLPLYQKAPGLLELIGGPDVSDYLDLLAVAGREEEAWTALLAARGDAPAWVLHAVPATSPTVTALPSLAGVADVAVSVAVEERCPVLPLPGTWDMYLAGLSGKHRHEMLRKIRRLMREVPESRATCAATVDAIAERFDDFLTLHRRSRTGKARFMDERMEAFFRRAVGALAAHGGARIWFLDTPDGPIASFVTLEWDGTVGLYNSGFDPARAALSPGLVLLARLVEDAIARGKERFDFLRGEERYKYDFGPTPEDVYAVKIGAERAP
jgi:CelD/BcsL family acetyltransferase involved in cellulose biosynthesis